MINYTLREAVLPSDIEKVRHLVNETSFFNHEEIEVSASLVKERIQKGLKSDYFFIFMDLSYEKLAGYTCYGPVLGTQSSFDLYWIAIDKNYQNLGLGKKLISETENKIKKMGGKQIYIETSSSDLYLPTRKFYESCGYKAESKLANFYKPGDDLINYSKSLI